jgi:DNA (cytosine-5)-methyltransferase 1
MRAWYNEIDPHAAQWLRNLIEAGEIPEGVVDERSIVDLRADELDGFDECHFFAGIGVWARAVRDAENALGHRLERPLFTGSCPCQPLSVAGRGLGHVDERHLWPAFHNLIAQRGPATIVGEQVASKDGREWMAAVRADLEASGYAVGTAILPACGVGAPHLRYRLFWMADAEGGGRSYRLEGNGPPRQHVGDGVRPSGGYGSGDNTARNEEVQAGDSGATWAGQALDRPRPPDSFWNAADWLYCRDGKWRPVEPGTFPLVDGSAFKLGSGGPYEGQSRAGMLRGYGNAVTLPVARAFVEAAIEAGPGHDGCPAMAFRVS